MAGIGDRFRSGCASVRSGVATLFGERFRSGCEWAREWAYINYQFWLCVAAAFGVLVIVMSLVMGGSQTVVGWLSMAVMCHFLVVWGTVGVGGRWWLTQDMGIGWVVRWNGGATLQCIGIAYAVAIGAMASDAKFKPWLTLIYTCYAFSISRYMKFPMRFDFTMAWICTTGSGLLGLELGKGHRGNWGWLVGISAVLVGLMFLGKYLDDYHPPTKEIYEAGMTARAGPRAIPPNAPPFTPPPPPPPARQGPAPAPENPQVPAPAPENPQVPAPAPENPQGGGDRPATTRMGGHVTVGLEALQAGWNAQNASTRVGGHVTAGLEDEASSSQFIDFEDVDLEKEKEPFLTPKSGPEDEEPQRRSTA
ncbi:unnamed protein product [Linum trigynum]|uniref:Uncharacterized protein n=1 Tax=Linum trigynum TaxID=586398 RepID=A0AAV2F1V0_9ROSI